jgi:hypothetical protein
MATAAKFAKPIPITKKGGDLKKFWITFIKLHETL